MKKKIAASKAFKKKEPEGIRGIVPLAQSSDLSYLDTATIAALYKIEVSVQYRGSNVYLIKHKAPLHEQMLSLPRKEDFVRMIKKELGVNIEPLIVKEREKECFTCNMVGGRCLDPKTCGQPDAVNNFEK